MKGRERGREREDEGRKERRGGDRRQIEERGRRERMKG
jgi:hypothetical protein